LALPVRHFLPHTVPLWVHPDIEVYYLTLVCQPRQVNHLAQPDKAHALIGSLVRYERDGFWYAHLALLMPDHLHGLFSFPPSRKPMVQVVRDWKRWTNRQLGIPWQRDFFEHRLRPGESGREKARYILENPVRAGLVESAERWPHVRRGDCSWQR